MKKTVSALRTSRPLLCAVGGYLAGVLLFALLGYDAFSHAAPPLTSAFFCQRPFFALVEDFSNEALLFAVSWELSFLLKNPLPSLAALLWRGMLFGFSATYLYGVVGALPLYLAYVALNTAVVVAYAALAATHTNSDFPQDSQALFPRAFPFLYFTGVIFLLVILRHLAYALLLPR